MKKKYYSDLERLRKMKDEEIDFSDIPELDESFFEKAVVMAAKPKSSVRLKLDQDVVEWFKSQGKGYQNLINSLLRAYMEADKEEFSIRERPVRGWRPQPPSVGWKWKLYPPEVWEEYQEKLKKGEVKD